MLQHLPVIREFLAGAGLLMFGLYLFEEAVKSLGGRHLKRLLEAETKTLRRGMRAGTWISALTTSSTFVSLLLVAFVGAGLLGLHNAIGVVLGANIGTTFNSLWVAYMGFGEFKIAKYALPLIAIGGIVHMVTRNKTWLYISHICIGIGLLFVGLEYMKESVETIAKSIDLTRYTNLWAFGFAGFLITGLLHSQAAMQIITLAALSGGIITLGPAFAIIIGANVGTTMTALTASLGGSRAHKQVALAHFFQNLISAFVGVLLFNQFLWICGTRLANYLGYAGNNVLATAWFNTVFNITTAIPFIIFPHTFATFIEKLTPKKISAEHHFMIEKFRGIGPVKHTIGIQLNALLKDCVYMKEELQTYIYTIINKKHSETQPELVAHTFSEEERLEQYHNIKNKLDFLYNALIPLQESSLIRSDVLKMRKVELLLSLITDTAKAYKSISNNLDELRHAGQPLFQELIGHLDTQILGHTIDTEPSPPLMDLQKSFFPAITAATQIPEIDIPTLISTQHGLSQAYTSYQKLIETYTTSS